MASSARLSPDLRLQRSSTSGNLLTVTRLTDWHVDQSGQYHQQHFIQPLFYTSKPSSKELVSAV